MKKPKISLIVALSGNKVIGNKGKIPWYIPEDLKRFRKITKGHVIIMGRKTFESIGKILLNRINIVVTKNKNYKIPKTVQSITQTDSLKIVNTIEEAIKLAKEKSHSIEISQDEEIFIIGGGKIFKELMKYANKLYLTIVKGNFEGDAFFPDYSEFKKVVYKKESKDKNYQYTFLELER